jgi:hypothetical protein
VSRRWILSFAALVLLLTPLLLGAAPPRQPADPITLQLEAGYGQRFRPDYWTPLLITVANDGPDASGALRVRAEANSGGAATYSTPIALPQQSRKQVFLYVTLQSFARRVQVELISDTGAVLATVDSQLQIANRQDVLAVVVTDAPGGSVDLTAAALGSGQVYQTNRAVENLPAKAEALMALDALIFTDVDTGRLSVAQQTAVADWVLAGGHLVVTGGPNYRLTSAGLADLLPLTLSGSTVVDDLTPLAVFTGRRADTLQEPDVVLATGVLHPEATVLVETGGEALLTRRVYGAGLVDYLAVDPGLAPFRRWPERAALWDALLFVAHQQPSWAQGVQDWMMADRVVRQSPGFALPSALGMFGMLMLYIFVIGPLNYAVLRLVGRRELAWLTIPVIVIVFSVLAYATGFSLRGTQATLNRLSMVQVWPGQDRARVDGLVGILSPRRSLYTLSAGPGLTLRPLPEPGASGLTPVLAATEITEGDVYAAQDVLVDASLIAGFASSGFVDGAPQLEGQATLTRSGSGMAVRGTVVNSTGFELDDAAVLVAGGVQHLGALAPGARATFDLRLLIHESAPLALVMGEDSALTFDNLELTAQDVMGRDYYPNRYYTTSSGMEERLSRQRQNLVAALAYDRDFSGGRGDRVFVFGWARTSPLAMTLEGAPWAPDDVTLYVFELPVTLEAPAEAMTILPGLAAWAVAPGNTVPGAQPYNLTVSGAQQASFRFTPLPSARLARVERLEVLARRTSPGTATILLKNWMTDSWDELALESGMRASLDEIAPYLGPNDAVEVLILPDDINGLASFSEIGVRWHGAF